jgi:uncharacterized membrane protein
MFRDVENVVVVPVKPGNDHPDTAQQIVYTIRYAACGSSAVCDVIVVPMSTYLLAFLIGVIAGLRSLTAPAVVSWAARLGWLHVENTWMAFLGFAATPYILSVLAIGELVADKLPKTPSRKAPPGFITRIITGALSGAAVGVSSSWVLGLVAGVIGAIAGTLGGSEFRVRLVKATGGKDLPIALLEDAIAIGGAFLLVSRFS